MTDDELEDSSFGNVDDNDGGVASRKVQTSGRVNIPESYLEDIGVGVGDSVFVIQDGDSVTIMKASVENIQ